MGSKDILISRRDVLKSAGVVALIWMPSGGNRALAFGYMGRVWAIDDDLWRSDRQISRRVYALSAGHAASTAEFAIVHGYGQLEATAAARTIGDSVDLDARDQVVRESAGRVAAFVGATQTVSNARATGIEPSKLQQRSWLESERSILDNALRSGAWTDEEKRAAYFGSFRTIFAPSAAGVSAGFSSYALATGVMAFSATVAVPAAIAIGLGAAYYYSDGFNSGLQVEPSRVRRLRHHRDAVIRQLDWLERNYITRPPEGAPKPRAKITLDELQAVLDDAIIANGADGLAIPYRPATSIDAGALNLPPKLATALHNLIADVASGETPSKSTIDDLIDGLGAVNEEAAKDVVSESELLEQHGQVSISPDALRRIEERIQDAQLSIQLASNVIALVFDDEDVQLAFNAAAGAGLATYILIATPGAQPLVVANMFMSAVTPLLQSLLSEKGPSAEEIIIQSIRKLSKQLETYYISIKDDLGIIKKQNARLFELNTEILREVKVGQAWNRDAINRVRDELRALATTYMENEIEGEIENFNTTVKLVSSTVRMQQSAPAVQIELNRLAAEIEQHARRSFGALFARRFSLDEAVPSAALARAIRERRDPRFLAGCISLVCQSLGTRGPMEPLPNWVEYVRAVRALIEMHVAAASASGWTGDDVSAAVVSMRGHLRRVAGMQQAILGAISHRGLAAARHAVCSAAEELGVAMASAVRRGMIEREPHLAAAKAELLDYIGDFLTVEAIGGMRDRKLDSLKLAMEMGIAEVEDVVFNRGHRHSVSGGSPSPSGHVTSGAHGMRINVVRKTFEGFGGRAIGVSGYIGSVRSDRYRYVHHTKTATMWTGRYHAPLYRTNALPKHEFLVDFEVPLSTLNPNGSRLRDAFGSKLGSGTKVNNARRRILDLFGFIIDRHLELRMSEVLGFLRDNLQTVEPQRQKYEEARQNYALVASMMHARGGRLTAGNYWPEPMSTDELFSIAAQAALSSAAERSSWWDGCVQAEQALVQERLNQLVERRMEVVYEPRLSRNEKQNLIEDVSTEISGVKAELEALGEVESRSDGSLKSFFVTSARRIAFESCKQQEFGLETVVDVAADVDLDDIVEVGDVGDLPIGLPELDLLAQEIRAAARLLGAELDAPVVVL